MLALSQSMDAVVLALWGDGASSNVRWMKHLCGVAERDKWPSNLLLDPQEVCLLHQVHRIKTYSMESLSAIGLIFCLSKLVRTGSVWPAFVDALGEIIDNSTERIPCVNAPAEAAARARSIFTLLYDMDRRVQPLVGLPPPTPGLSEALHRLRARLTRPQLGSGPESLELRKLAS